MNKLIFLIAVVLMLFLSSCSDGADCRTCTGTVTNTGDIADFTVCFEDEVLTQTNNLTGDVITSTNTLPESVAFLQSIGLACEE